jgi:transposase
MHPPEDTVVRIDHASRIFLAARHAARAEYVYGYLNRAPSSRRLEREAGRNVEAMWLTGRLVPDHKTIADFS